MSRHNYIEPLDLYPLTLRMDERTEPGRWSRYYPGQGARGERWEITRALCVHLPGVTLLPAYGSRWRTDPVDRAVYVEPGHTWNGASGPAIDDPSAVLGSLVHDIACARRDDGSRVVPGYHARHWLYARILRVQGEPWARCVWSYVGLLAGNWAVMLRETPGTDEGDIE